MSATDSYCEGRNSFRCPVAESRQSCALRIGADTVPGRLIDESAGGFAVLISGQHGLESGQAIYLQTDSGWFQVQVMYVGEAPPPEESDSPDAEPTHWFRLGLQRLGEAIPPEAPSTSTFAGDLRFRLRQSFPSKGLFSSSGVLLALAVLIVPLVLIGVLRYTRSSGVGSKATSSNARAPLPVRESGAIPPADNTSSAEVFKKAAPAPGGVAPFPRNISAVPTSELNAFHPQTELELRNLVRQLPGPTAFGLTDVVRRLRLSNRQQELIQKLIDAMADVLQKLELDEELHGADRYQINELRDKLFDDYLRRALELLTPEQRAEWEQLHDMPAANDSKKHMQK